jgi:hypothetical protein
MSSPPLVAAANLKRAFLNVEGIRKLKFELARVPDGPAVIHPPNEAAPKK